MTVPFALVHTPDRLVNQLQQNIAKALKNILGLPQAQGLILTKISLGVGLTSVPHTLGRTLIGWQITRQRGPASIYDTQDNNSAPGASLFLNSSAAVVVDLFVF